MKFANASKYLILSMVVGWAGIAAPLPTLDAAPQSVADDNAVVADELSEDELRQIQTAERFLSILKRNPRRGTALDRVYGHHIEFGTLDELVDSLEEEAKEAADDGAASMLLGLFESQRGNDGAAVDAFERAEELRPDDAMAPYYLAQSQLRIGQAQEAVASMERAIACEPRRADLLEIYQQLGRVHQRAQRTDDAMEVWQRLESLFPDDPRVLEQIAVTLAEEGQPALALPKYETLATLVNDDYRRVMYEVAAAELRIKTGERDEGIAALEKILSDLNPDGWLYRDVRRRIDDVFLRSGDQDNLVKYYERWLEAHPDDIDGMSRLARFLASSARMPEARQWMEKALELAPSRTDLRKSYIDLLVNDQRFAEAIEQYEALVESAPGNPDFLRDWGKLVLRNKEMAKADREQQAERIWNRMLEGHQDDAVVVSQVADLFRQNNLFPQAEELYRRGIELAPADPQYREYLGEFLFIRKRPEEALGVWSGIAQGDRKTAVNLTRLAEVYNSFGFPEKAVEEIAAAVELDPKSFHLQIRAADYHSRADKFDDAIAYIDRARELAANEDERESVVTQRIEILQTSQRLEEESERLAEGLREKPDATSTDWFRLARYYEAARRWADATAAIDRAIEIDPKSIIALTAAARIAETSGNYERAANTSRKLAQIDRRSRGDHLMNVSRLEAQLGRSDEALAAAKELIVSAPGNTDHYEFYAQMCFRMGQTEDGLEALRKAVRINPNEPHLIMALGAALAEQLRSDEAIEVYWRAFEKSDEVEDKVSLTTKLANLYQQTNRFDKLIERFERDRREEDLRRELTICLAQAWHTTGDFGAARQELESLLSEDTRDTNLLNQLAKLCQDGAELDAAIGYQRQLVAIAPGHETEFPLATMLMSNGQTDEAREIFVKLTRREEDPIRQMRTIDSLLRQGNNEAAIDVIEPLLAQSRDDWELLYREAIAWTQLEKTAEAKNRFDRILSLTLPYDSMGRSAEAKWKRDQAKAKSNNLRGITSAAPQRQSPLAMRSMAAQVQQATGLVADNRYYQPGTTPQLWTPDVYGVARMAAMGWLLKLQQDAEQETGADAESPADGNDDPVSFADAINQKAEEDDAPRNAIYDALYLAALQDSNQQVYQIARAMARDGGTEEKRFFLSSLTLRDAQPAGNQRNAAVTKTPLNEEDLQLVRDCYADLAEENQNVDLSAVYGGNIAYDSNGQAYALIGGSYQMLSGVFKGEGVFLNTLVEELRLAGHEEEAETLLNEHLQEAETAGQLAAAMALLLQEDRDDEIEAYFQRWHQAALEQIDAAPVEPPARGSNRTANAQSKANANVLAAASLTVQRWMGQLAAAEENDQLLTILDSVLDVSIAEAKHRRLVDALKTRRSPRATTSTTNRRVLIIYGEESNNVNVAFPPSSLFLDSATMSLLRQVHENLTKNDVGSDLVDRLQTRLAAADDADSVAVLCNQLYLAGAAWWADERDDAIEWMAKVSEQLPNDLSMQFDMASMYEQRGDFDDALTIIESIEPRDQQVLQRKEIAVLQLAERIGDIDRARTAAERLFGLRLSSQMQLSLVKRMRRLGLSEMADAVISRIERTSSNQASSMASLMMLYQGQGKTDKANQVAHMLLRRTSSPMSVNARSSRNPLRYQSSESGVRKQAISVLQRSGALNDLVERLETQYARSPDSDKLLEQLIEFYSVTGEKKKALTLLTEGVERRPDSPMLHLQLAKQFEQTAKISEACDEYLEVLKLQPNWITSELYQIQRVFRQAKRQVDLVKGLTEVDLSSISQPYYLGQAASSLLQEGENVEVAIALLERAFDAFPQYRSDLFQNFRDPEILKNPRVYAFAKKMVVPSAMDIKSNRWTGVDRIYSNSGNGEVSTQFDQLLQGIKSTDNIEDFETTIRSAAEANSDWLGGQAMLAMIELATDRDEAGRKRLESIVDDEEVMQTIPSDACWIIGQVLDRSADTEELAMRLFEKAVKNPSRNHSSQLQYSPVAKLIQAYEDDGRKEDARDLLLDQLNGIGSEQYDQSYASYQRLESMQWAGKRLLALNFPVDAIRMYRQTLDDPEAMQAAVRFSGRGENGYKTQAEAGIKEALALMKPEMADEMVAQLLSVDGEAASRGAAVDLMVGIPGVDASSVQPMESAYVALLIRLSQDTESATAIVKRLDDLGRQYPDDVSIAIADAAWKLQSGREGAGAAVDRVSSIVESNPLEAIAQGRRPNSRQRKNAASYLPVWLVARQCLSQPERREVGQSLAEVALTAAERQVSFKDQTSVLFEWGQRLAEQGDIEGAQKRWSQLLDTVTQRPTTSGKTANEGSDTKKDFVPPLTVSQFRVAALVGKAAAQRGMPALSRKAVREALRGGFPVADVSSDSLSNSQSNPYAIVTSSSSSNDASADPIETEVVQSLKGIVQLWSGEQYPPSESFDVLAAMVLPDNRPQEVLMYVDADIFAGEAQGLAEPLIESAAAADRLDELARRLDERAEGGTNRVAIPAMETLIAIARGEMETANEKITQLATASATGLSTADAQIAFLAARRAFAHGDLKAAAFPILRRSLEDKMNSVSANNSTELNLSASLPRLVNEYLASVGDAEAVQEYVESLLASRQTYYSRYSGDYGLYQQWRDLAEIAAQTAKLKLPNLTLNLVARTLDFDVANYSRPALDQPLSAISNTLRSVPAQQRYRTWKDWTLPAANRLAIRFLAEPTRSRYIPAAFLEGELAGDDQNPIRIVSNFTELVAAAEAADQLEDLRSEVEPLVEAGMPDAEPLLGLIAIAMDDQSTAIAINESLASSMKERSKTVNSRRGTPMLFGDYLVLQACFQSEVMSPLFDDQYANLRSRMIENSQVQLMNFLVRDWNARVSSPAPRSSAYTDFKHWIPATADKDRSGTQPWWTSYQNQLVHLWGPKHDHLYLQYPLTGDFSLSIERFDDSWAESSVGINGMKINSENGRTTIKSISDHESITRKDSFNRARPAFGTVRFDSQDSQLTYSINGQSVYTEPASSSSPWLTLTTWDLRFGAMRNLQIEGSPVIPREVAMIGEDRLDGWNCSAFGESQPRHRLMGETPEDENSSLAYYQKQEPAEFDWNVVDGVLKGRAMQSASGSPRQSWIQYERPLCDGDQVSYEFYYVPGQSVAHPAIGGVAMMLQPDGVMSHWISVPAWDGAGALPADNTMIEADCRRGPQSLPLQPNEWNRVSVKLAQGVTVVSLNDEIVFERPVEPQLSTRFGVFRYQNQAAQVRNLRLSGDWPEQWNDALVARITELEQPLSDEQRREVGAIVNDVPIAIQAGDAVSSARQQSPEDAYEMLKAWVLPSPDHANTRLYYSLGQPPEDEVLANVLSPAVELIRLAADLKKIDELAAALEQLPEDASGRDAHNRSALSGLIALQTGDETAARLALQQAWQLLRDHATDDWTARQRHAEWVLAWQAAHEARYRTAALDLTRELRWAERDGNRKSGDNRFSRHVHALFGDIEQLQRFSSPESKSLADDGVTQWQSVAYWNPKTRWEGFRPSTWVGAKGSLQHMPSEAWSQLFFQSPLRGKFAVQAQHSNMGHEEISIGYGEHAAQPTYDLKDVRVHTLMHGSKSVAGSVELPHWDHRTNTRLEVDGDKLTTYSNGVKIHEETLESSANPWLMLQSDSPTNYSAISDLRITGTPTIPAEIDLIDINKWSGWRVDMYGGWHSMDSASGAPWKRDGDELVGSLHPNSRSENFEGLMLYQRPMLEDGVIEMECWYEPGAYEVHPALGLNAFLIAPDGVRRHRLTDTWYESSGLPADNVDDIDGAAETVPLKENAWNHVRLQLAGDRLTIAVNDVDVLAWDVTLPKSERQFGLFRYITQTECRVRKLTYRGDWPKSLPTVAEQDLAAPPGGAFAVSGSTTTLETLDQFQAAGFTVKGPADRTRQTSAGIEQFLHDSKGYESWPALDLNRVIEGDFQVTVDYADLEITPVQEGWGVVTGLRIEMDDREKSLCELQMSLDPEGRLICRTHVSHQLPSGEDTFHEGFHVHDVETAGRLRMIRRGGQMHCLTAAADSDNFRWLAAYPVGTAAVKSIEYGSKCSDSAATVEITLKRLSLTEQE
ncbi:DUF1583 domain-containing protein [Allorhodopirellula solitaria]|uniref:Tetratricopeptide repeat protein n=1 Tax=Allorhodopirellula solitaria TaxID=2527987 RepID=A0A5C5YD27_9BACT|nr:DUF1583 domain-containing protein [Allorhodopirellula solitaria]TWT72849.1 tetratricopeptide repeat protein [Allorhodopirellula solitaria]